MGRINNLMSSDLAAIAGGRNFLMVLINTPLSIGLSIGFLYWQLGWRYALTLSVFWEAES